jgi:hypothetical protein
MNYGVLVGRVQDKDIICYLYSVKNFYVEKVMEFTTHGCVIKMITAFKNGFPLEKYLNKIEINDILND